jgi:small subunit ribosomal protein S1
VAPEAPDNTEAVDVADTAEAAETTDTAEAAETTDTAEAAETTDTAEATEGPDATDSPPAAPPPRREPKVVKGPADVGDLPDDIGPEDFAAAVDRTVVEFKEGDLVEGSVVRVDPDEVLIDIGYKSEGVIPLKELSIRNDVNPAEEVSVGERLEALVLQMEDQEGRLILSKKRAQYERAWGKIEKVMHEGGTVEGRVIEVVKGGLIVDIGLRGFLPASLVELRRVRDLQPFVGQDLEAKVIELDRNRNNVVLSRRAYLEEEQAEARSAFLDDLQPGEIRKGVVSSVVNFGAFVDLGGMDGLVHVSELSWEHVSHPGEVVTVGDEVMVKVLEIDLDRERISLSVRQTSADPWETFSEKYELGDVVEGKVTKTVPFGAFVSVGDGVEGLVHVSEIASHHVDSPELELSLGRAVNVKITEIDVDRRRISLSIKQASPEWQERATAEPERKPRRHEFEPADEEAEDEESARQPAFNADASLEAILQELKEKGIGRK